MDPSFVKLHYPCYRHYDVLFGLAVLRRDRAGPGSPVRWIFSSRSGRTRVPAAEQRYYRTASASARSQVSLVQWGGVSRRQANFWVSARAVTVRHQAGRSVEGPRTGSADGEPAAMATTRFDQRMRL